MKYELPDWCVIGAKFRELPGKPNFPELWHVRGLVDGMAVCRAWQRHKQRWRYEVKDPIHFHVREIEVKS
mgnify:CR=1 FL=1